LARKLAACSSFAVGAGVGLIGADSAQGEVIRYLLPGGGATIYPYASGQPYTYSIDIDGDGIDDFNVFDRAYFGEYMLVEAYTSATNKFPGSDLMVAIAAPGATIGPDTSDWIDFGYLDSFRGTRGYTGVVFDIPGGSPHFGYLDIGMAADRSSLTVYGGAYESLANTPITIPIPEPGSLLLLAGGAAGLAAWRRKRGSTPTLSAN
jgi:hypothetical protein